MNKSVRILSIDDSKTVHTFIERSLESTRFSVLHAMSGTEGLKLLSETNETISLVLLDWEMPEQSGPEILPQIKALRPNLPVIMLTSKNNPEDIMKMIEAGASEYVMKPFTPDILIEKIESVLGV